MSRCLLALFAVFVHFLDGGFASEPIRPPICVDEAECPSGLSLLQTQAAPAAILGRRSSGHSNALQVTPCSSEDLAKKDLDVIVYGATGFTGKLAAKYLAAGHPQHPSWAIAGHSKNKLDDLNASLVGSSQHGPPSAILVADLGDIDALKEMTRRAKSVVTFAGPYERYNGSNLIRAAVDTCTNYVDISGEPIWKAHVLQEFGALAKARGVAVVQSSGLDALPADFVALWAAKRLAADGNGPPTDVTIFFSKLNSAVSGGTIESGKDAAKEGMNIQDRAHAYALSPETPPEAQVDDTPAGQPPHVGPPSLFGYDANFSSFTVPHMMSVIDGPVVRRSLGLTFPGTPIRLAEVSGQSLFTEYAQFLSDPMMLQEPMKMQPKQGEGPPEWVLQKGGMVVQGLAARGEPHAGKASITMDCKGEPGYALTPKWAVEVALGLAEKSPVGEQGGYLTPSTAIEPDVLLGRLQRTNCSFQTSGSGALV